MPNPRYIFFDVGNTLLFPNRARMLAPLPADRHPTLAAWQALERRTKHEFDQGMTKGKVDHSFWWTFHTYLLQERNALNDGTRDALIANTQNSANWDQILPGTAKRSNAFAAAPRSLSSRTPTARSMPSCNAAASWIVLPASPTQARSGKRSRIQQSSKQHCAT
jgi:hypothetical protein